MPRSKLPQPPIAGRYGGMRATTSGQLLYPNSGDKIAPDSSDNEDRSHTIIEKAGDQANDKSFQGEFPISGKQ